MRFYATAAPDWWPFQTVSLGYSRTPKRRAGECHYYMLLDNGMWSWRKERSQPPPLDWWLTRLHSRARVLSARGDTCEVLVVLPDWPGTPELTVRAASLPAARRLCEEYPCLVPVHLVGGQYLITEPPQISALAEAAASLPGEPRLAGPMKLYCMRQTPGGRRVPLLECQARFTSLLVRASRAHGLGGPHLFAPALSPSHIARLHRIGAASFDSNTWTRPNPTRLRGMSSHSANNATLKTRFLRTIVSALLETGVPLERAREVLATLD